MTGRGFALLTLLIGVFASPAFAQEHAHGPAVSNALVKVVREVTEPYKNVAAAEAAGYALAFGCVSGPDTGAMGMHFVNMPLVLDGEINASRPEIVIYEPMPDGQVRLVGADYLVFKGGRATIGPLVLGSAELRGLRALAETAVYTSAKREVSLRAESIGTAIELADSLLSLRLAA